MLNESPQLLEEKILLENEIKRIWPKEIEKNEGLRGEGGEVQESEEEDHEE